MQPFLQWKSHKYYTLWVCICGLSYPACNAHAPFHIVICDLPGSTIFFHIFSQRPRLPENKGIKHKTCVLIFSTNFIWNISRYKQAWVRKLKNVNWSACKVPDILVEFWWIFNFQDRFSKKKNSNIKFRKNPFSESRAVPCGLIDGRTDGQMDKRTGMTKLIDAFRNFAYARKNSSHREIQPALKSISWRRERIETQVLVVSQAYSSFLKRENWLKRKQISYF